MKLLINSSQLHSGKIQINGYKHSMVQIIALAVVLNQKTLIKNIPLVDDTFVLQRILRQTGCVFDIKDKSIYFDPTGIFNHVIDGVSSEIHGSMYLFSAFAARFGKIRFSGSGGCLIGDEALQGKRPFEHISDVLEEFGYIGNKCGNDYTFEKKKSNPCFNVMKYSDNSKYLSGSRVSSTTKVGILLSAKNGCGKILNPYFKNDVMDMLRYLSLYGFEVYSDKKCIEISADNINKKSDIVEFTLSDCVSEVITYITLAIMNDIKLYLKITDMKQLKKALAPEVALIKKIGINVKYYAHGISVNPVKKINPVNIKVLHTTIQSDHHPFFTLLLTKAYSPSSVREYVWRNRFKYVQELNKLGFKIVRTGNKVDIFPSGEFVAKASLNGCDTRAVALLIIASLTAHADVEILDAGHLMRGYGDFLENLGCLGANIERVA